MNIYPVSPDHPEVQTLILALDAYQNALYPAESNHLDGIDTLKKENVTMLGAWDARENLAGIGALKVMDGYGEIKRMVVAESHRKKGIGKRLLQALEHTAAAQGIRLIRLETGIRQDAAIELYKSAGFGKRDAFGTYPEDPLSLFMEKPIPSFDRKLSISPYMPEDHDSVIGLWQLCGLTRPWNDPSKDIRRNQREAPELFFLARLDDRVIGSCMAGYDGHRGWIYYLCVSPEFRNRGVAGKLVARGESALAERGCPKINLMVCTTNTEVIRFYQSKGYASDEVQVLGKRLVSDR